MSAPWTDEDVQKLRRMIVKGASAARTSVVLKRRIVVVKIKARELGLEFPPVARFSIDRINGWNTRRQ